MVVEPVTGAGAPAWWIGGVAVEIGRRQLGQAVAAAAVTGGLTLVTGGADASAATQPTLRVGSRGSAVVTLQRRLTYLGYWLGAVDGIFGDLTRQAVVAIQKVAGVSRDGIVGPVTWSKLNAGVRPSARSRSGHVIEINKPRQVLLVVDSGRVTRIFNTSTGSGQRYYSQGAWHVAVTPSGSFRVFRQVNGWDNSPLGRLYRPKYFNGGIAVHGYTSVPSYPASHGCVRISIPAMDLMWRAGGLAIGTPVLVY